jgi:hypothetical protein
VESSLTNALAISLIASDLCAEVAVLGIPSHSMTCLATSDIPSDQELVSHTSILRLQNLQMNDEGRSAVIVSPAYNRQTC